MRVRFHPQAWVNDWAIEVDPQGETEREVGDVPDDIEDDTYESDVLRFHDNAPQWVQDWAGPFYVEILRDKADERRSSTSRVRGSRSEPGRIDGLQSNAPAVL